MRLAKHKLSPEKIRPHLFWDIPPGRLDWDKSAILIVQRVLTRGTFDEFRLLLEVYKMEGLKEIALKIPYLDRKSLNFISGFLEIPKEEFKCYKKQQLNPVPWKF